ncbi:MAG: hypothetical protein H6828_00370 [Planctomycetes bacterium]|nr:hypothetical protein [Planctomycetota bacterium]
MALPRSLSALVLALAACHNPPTGATHAPVGAPSFDCNRNGVEDAIDVCIGASADLDQDGIPDECEAR